MILSGGETVPMLGPAPPFVLVRHVVELFMGVPQPCPILEYEQSLVSFGGVVVMQIFEVGYIGRVVVETVVEPGLYPPVCCVEVIRCWVRHRRRNRHRS